MATKIKCSITKSKLNTIADAISSHVGSFVLINDTRCYVGNIFDLPGNRRHWLIGAVQVVVYPLADWKRAEREMVGLGSETLAEFTC